MIEWNEKIYTDSVVNSKLKKYKKAILKNNSRKQNANSNNIKIAVIMRIVITE